MLSLLFLSCFVASALGVGWDVETDLDRYVHFDDGYFSYEELEVHRYENLSVTVYTYNMTSQKWLDEDQVSKSIWWHMCGVIIPDEIADYERAWIFTEGGSNRESTTPPDFNDPFNILGATVSANTGLIGAYVLNNPNSPIVFADDPTQRSRSEDRLIAWTWRSYLNNPEPNNEIVARMPMTKAGKRGMDMVAEVAREKVPQSNINKFIVTGASKRGWTAMSIAAVDQRVEMCIPIVFTLLNMKENMIRHHQAMNGNWSFALEPYYDENVTMEVHNPKLEGITELEDMLNYKERLTMPKLFILATGDEFFFAQDLDTYWHELPDPKYLLFNPNTQHILFPKYLAILETLQGFMISLSSGAPLPSIQWEKGTTETGGEIEVWVEPAPIELNCTRAETLDDVRRDFRLLQGYPEVGLAPVWWNWVEAEEVEEGHYYYSEDNLEDGRWSGFFFRGLWNGPNDLRMFLSTAVQITPDSFPREPCEDADDCYGSLA
jgi:PhoPQ-activated pathogenicity-related protein